MYNHTQQWEPIILRNPKSAPVQKIQKTEKTLTQKLDVDDPNKPKMVTKSLAQQVINARMKKGWNRKQFANQINQQESYVSQFESCKVIINHNILQKMRKVLETKLSI